MARLFQILKGIYYGETPGALRGPQALFEQAKKLKVKNVTLANCREFLKSQPVYTRNRPARKNYRRNHIEANIPGDVVQVDIWDLQSFKADNQHLYVLLAYDTFSKYLSGVPLLNRKPDSVQAGLEALIASSPFEWKRIYWDKEGSFVSRQIQGFLKNQSIHNYTTKSRVKAPGVERSIRTLRNLLQRRMEASGSLKWEKELPKLISNYNRRRHSTTKLVPAVLAESPWLLAEKELTFAHNDKDSPVHKPKLPPIGSFVRLNRLRGIFEKEASNTWTEEVFRVVRHKTTAPIPLIYVEDLQGDKIEGGLYPEEYQAVEWDGKKTVDQVLKTRQQRAKPKEYLVSYKGWPKKFNEWTTKKPS